MNTARLQRDKRRRWKSIRADLKFGQIDKSGEDYILHPIAVADSLNGVADYLKVAALLHDVVKDTDTALEDLKELDFDPRAIAIVKLLTRIEQESYDQFIKRISDSENYDAILVKTADIRHNLSRRFKGDESLHHRYKKALDILNKKYTAGPQIT